MASVLGEMVVFEHNFNTAINYNNVSKTVEVGFNDQVWHNLNCRVDGNLLQSLGVL